MKITLALCLAMALAACVTVTQTQVDTEQDRYYRCAEANARELARRSNEIAEVIAHAAAARCPAEREAVRRLANMAARDSREADRLMDQVDNRATMLAIAAAVESRSRL